MKKLWHYLLGKQSWRVDYGTHGHSIPMTYGQASDYAQIFHGVVKFDPEVSS